MNLPEYIQLAIADPTVIVYTEEMAFERLENILVAAMEEPDVESRIYAFTSRPCLKPIIKLPTFLEPLHCDKPIAQRLFFDPVTKKLTSALSVEGKSLLFRHSNISDWKAEYAPMDASLAFEATVTQLREQAQHAFANFDMDEHYVMLHVGNFFSLLLFNRENEKKVCDMEERSYTSTPQRPGKRQRKNSNDSEVLQDILSEKQLPSGLLPRLIYVNQPILVEREGGGEGRIPWRKFNEYFLHALHLAASAHGFDLQPC
ncbi:hypothetical protein BDP27DRAFT_1428627 [Rhodocollybia butyracea]|uniref:Uncharacterized protein n=1 Tax=Rhodocollybia butyracea TaxID=206335 RepID=A0A9P5PGP4_9AGAR|nr:hypothetical protein BDP27DRAFT_1428627 [Rhodocollybia butyracea]